jgi:hypothetical protein
MKLYRCSIEFTYMVLAETEEEAQDIAREAHSDDGAYVDARDIDAMEERDRLCCGDWTPGSLVYGDHKTDMTLLEAWDMMKIPKPDLSKYKKDLE